MNKFIELKVKKINNGKYSIMMNSCWNPER